MIRSWPRFLASVGLAIAMLGAPCRNCAPKEEPKAHCGHDCCPKPKPERESKPCSWQPAGFDAIERAKQAVEPDWQAQEFAPASPAVAALFSEAAMASFLDDRPPPQPPPAALLPLRI